MKGRHPPNYFLSRQWSYGQGSKKKWGTYSKKKEDKDIGGKRGKKKTTFVLPEAGRDGVGSSYVIFQPLSSNLPMSK